EALAHPGLVKGGPGRADNGSFALTDIRVLAAPLDGKSKPVPVKLVKARATFEQKGLPVASALTGNKKSGWAVDPQFGRDHAAVFEPAAPFGFPGGTELTIILEFKNNKKHAIGRPRLALAAQATPPLDGFAWDERTAQVITKDNQKKPLRKQEEILFSHGS